MTAPAAVLAPWRRRRVVRARSLTAWYRNGPLMAGIVIVGALVAIVGARPAGLLLRAGVDAVTLPVRDRAHVEARICAAVPGQGLARRGRPLEEVDGG